MKTLHIILLTLFSTISLSAQSLYQDALSLAEILRKDQQVQNRELENEPPKLVFVKERQGVYSTYGKFSPALFTAETGTLENRASNQADNEQIEFQQNRFFLYDAGYYTIHGFDRTDTIEVQFAKDLSVKLHSELDSMILQASGYSTVKIAYDSVLILHNTYKKMSFVGRDKKVLVQYEQTEADQTTRVFNRKIILLPEAWNQLPISGLTGKNKERQIISSFNTNEVFLVNGCTYTLKRELWSPYLIYVKQGEELLSSEQNAFRIIDSLEFSYNEEKKQISGSNVYAGGYKYDRISITDQDLFPFQFHGCLEYTLEDKENLLSLELDSIVKVPSFMTANDEDMVIELRTSDYYGYTVDTVKTDRTSLQITSYPEDSSYYRNYYITNRNYIYNNYNQKDTFNLFFFTDRTGKLYQIEATSIYMNDQGIFFYTPFDSYSFLFKTKDLRNVASILSIHHNFKNKDVYGNRYNNTLLKGTLAAYKRNEILSNPLATYLSRERTIEEDYNLSEEIANKLLPIYESYYPWQGILYQNQQLNLEKSVSYQAVLANARKQANTASRNLQRATQQLASQQKASRGGGLNAATIAAGLSDFIVESAQEELNMNFLSRMRTQIKEEHPEFQILFPNTLERFTDFQVTQYRSFLGNSKLAFQADLNNLAFSFPTLFTHEKTRDKYAVLSDDPSVYNISLVYDIASKVYEETPMDSVLLHMHSRLDDRLGSLDKRVINTMSGRLLKSSEGKDEIADLSTEIRTLFSEIDRFDLMTYFDQQSMHLVMDSINIAYEKDEKVQKEILQKRIYAYENQYNYYFGYLFEELDSNIMQNFSAYLPYNNIIQVDNLPDSLQSFYKNMGKNFILDLPLSQEADSSITQATLRNVNRSTESISRVKLKQYEAVIPASLNGEIQYDYKIRHLPYEQFDDYFKNVPTDSMLVAEGLFLLKDFLEGEQLKIRRDWIKNYSDFLETKLPILRERQNRQLRTFNPNPYPEQLARFHQIEQQYIDFQNILNRRIEDLEKRAKTFKILEGILAELDKKYEQFLLDYEREKEAKKSTVQLERMIEKQQEEAVDYLQKYIDQKQKNLNPQEVKNLLEEGDRIQKETLIRYNKLKEENNPSALDVAKRVELGIKSVERTAQRRFEKVEEDFFRKKDQFNSESLKAGLAKQQNKELNFARKSFNALRTNIIPMVAVQDSTLKRQITSAETALMQKVRLRFTNLEETLKDVSTLEWLSGKKAEKLVEKRMYKLKEKLAKNKNRATQIRSNRILQKEEIKVQQLIKNHFEDLESRLSKTTTNGQLSNRKRENIAKYTKSTNALLQQHLKQLKNKAQQKKNTRNRSKELIHAARSLEYLSLQLGLTDFGSEYGDISYDNVASSIYDWEDYSYNPKDPTSALYPWHIEAIGQMDMVHKEAINKSIEVLTQIDETYGKSPQAYYSPIPTQAQIDDLLALLPDSSKVDLFSYYGNTYFNDILLNEAIQDTLQMSDVQYLEELLEAELIIIRPPNEEQSLDFVNYFEQVLACNQSMNLWLDSIAIQYDLLRNRMELLEKEYAGRAYEAKKHAQHLSTLTELSVHVLDAFKYGAFAIDSITVSDTLHQRIEEIVGNKKVIYNQVALKEKVIAKGSHVNKWISRAQFRQVMEDSLTQQAYLGLLYQRFANIKDYDDFSPDGLALVTSKLINTIYNMDDLRATLQYKKRLGKDLSFQDYYPFIRTTIDFINTLLETPIGERSFGEQYKELEAFALISDQSLKLFENISSETYGQAIDNLVNIFAYIWDVDLAQATQEQQWMQALPTLKSQGKNREVAAIQKELRKVQSEEEKQLRKGERNNRRLKKALLVYGKFIANIAMAEDANSVKAALRAVAAPPGSSSVKRNSRANVSLNSYFGGGFYREQLNINSLTKEERTSGSIGLSVPVGVTGTIGGLGKNNWSLSLFVPILDLGIFTAYRIDQQNAGQSADLPDLNFGNLIAPGGFLIVNIPKSPFSISGGAQFGPQLREATVNGNAELTSAWRYGLTATIDVPIFNLFNR